MDVQMPELSGFAATAQIRQEEAARARKQPRESRDRLPIVAMTAYATKGDRERCLEAGMDDYVSKPIRVKELFDTMDLVVARLRGRDPALDEPGDGPVAEAALVWDERDVIERTGNDRGLLLQIIKMFLESCPATVASLRSALAAGDSQALTHAAHSLRGAAGNVGGRATLASAAQVENLAKDRLMGEETQAAVQQLERDLGRLVKALDAIVPVLSEHESEVPAALS
jgi:two-component system, sensor histidine kinase and response regulator